MRAGVGGPDGGSRELRDHCPGPGRGCWVSGRCGPCFGNTIAGLSRRVGTSTSSSTSGPGGGGGVPLRHGGALCSGTRLPRQPCSRNSIARGRRGSGEERARGARADWANLERDAFEDALRIEEEPDHWRKILIHSLAIRRDLYVGAGGLQPVYGDFAPWPLAIALHSEGKRLIFSPPRGFATYTTVTWRTRVPCAELRAWRDAIPERGPGQVAGQLSGPRC